MDVRTSAFYSKNAEVLASKYIAADFEYEERLLRAFSKTRKILDVGCGTGRDLSLLLRSGKDAYGVDSSKEMLAAANTTLLSRGLSGEGRLFQQALPHLDLFADGEFDGVLCSAVLMHLPEEELFDAVYALRRVLKPSGVLMVSVPSERADVNPVTRRDEDGRFFNALPPAKLRLLFERIGFGVREFDTVADSLGRDGIEWSVTEFIRLDQSADRPLHLVESILNRDKKDATYKLALFRALAEIAQTQHHLAAFTPEGKVKIPIEAIADKWMLYYWPIFESDEFICQRTGEVRGSRKGVAIRTPLEALIAHFRSGGGMTGFYSDWKSGRLTSDAMKLFSAAKAKFQQTIWSMPVRYAGGGNFDVFQYDRLDKTVCMDESLWRELCLTGSWIQDATVLRWAELTEQLSKGCVKASRVIDCLLSIPDPARNVNDARRYFASLPGRVCVWSERSLDQDRFAVDHAMPFSLWRNNDLWNLFPAAPVINADKSDKLPSYDLLHRRKDTIIHYWRGLNEALGERFEREAQTLLGRDPFLQVNWEKRLFPRFVEAFEITAAQRGAARWEFGIAKVAPVVLRPAPSPVRYAESVEIMHCAEEAGKYTEPNIIPFENLAGGAYRTHLPIIGSLAAGSPFHGLETGSLDDVEDLGWVEVPTRHAKARRFVVRVAGNSMEPTLQIGDLVIFEYHRTPRRDREIVIANLPEFGPGTHGTEAIKRITQDAGHWIFESDNPHHQAIRVAKSATAYPILGTMIDVLKEFRQPVL